MAVLIGFLWNSLTLSDRLFYALFSTEHHHYLFSSLFTVPDSVKPIPAPFPLANPSAINPPAPSTSISGANGKRVPSSTQQQQSAVQRYPPREVPPRFRQHEHKQLLKRGQPLPAGSLAVVLPSSTSPTVQSFSSQSRPGPVHLLIILTVRILTNAFRGGWMIS